MKTGNDQGYNATKIVADNRRVIFPSAVGTPTRARFAVNGHNGEINLTLNGQNWLVGDAAVQLSRFVVRREDRNWVDSDEYLILALAGLSELTPASVEVQMVTGLPVNYFGDKMAVAARLLGDHKIQRAGRNAQTFKITDVRVIPQPFGALLNEALDQRGVLTNQDMAGYVGVIDVGGKTTNILSAHKLAELPNETTSINAGGWDIIRQLREYLAETIPGLELRDHELAAVLKERRVKVAGEWVELPGLAGIIDPMAELILATARQLWGAGLKLDSVLIAGGGAHLVGEQLRREFKQAVIVADPVYANATGFWKLAQRLGK